MKTQIFCKVTEETEHQTKNIVCSDYENIKLCTIFENGSIKFKDEELSKFDMQQINTIAANFNLFYDNLTQTK